MDFLFIIFYGIERLACVSIERIMTLTFKKIEYFEDAPPPSSGFREAYHLALISTADYG